MLYVLTPEISAVDHQRASSLLQAAEREWDDVPVSLIGPAALVGCEPADADGVVFFNPPRDDLSGDVEDLLKRAAEAGAVLLPVALDVEHRLPTGAAGAKQSFDVVDHLRRRELNDDQLGVIGGALAREALSLVMPTFVQSRMRVFLCHRRADAEGLAASLDTALSGRHEHVFRDLIDVQAGQEAQERIDDALAGADVLVFIDTPKAGESWWIQHELATALGRSIPVAWLRVGPAEDRSELAVRPDAEPHVLVDELELSPKRAGEIADEILRVAARLARSHARTSQQALHALKRWAGEQDATVEVLDARQRIFQVRHPPPSMDGRRPYPIRPATDVVQFFGRSLTDADRDALEGFLTERGMGPHDQECRAFDAAIMLDPTASGYRTVGEWSVAEHPEGFLGTLATSTPATAAGTRPRLLLLGAFPAGDYARDQIVPAVQAIAATWLRLGGVIVSGGHPTFVPLLVEAARWLSGGAGQDRLILFQSEWYAAPAQLESLAADATVIATAREASRDASLTLMRQRMVKEGDVAAVVAIGGRTDEGGAHRPGIEEEIRLARMEGLPVYLFGAAGGQATLIASREAAASVPWGGLGNAFDTAQNEWLRQTEEYEEATRAIWETLVR